MRVWDPSSSDKQLAVLEGHTSGVGALTYLPEPRLLASGSRDKTVRLWGAHP